MLIIRYKPKSFFFFTMSLHIQDERPSDGTGIIFKLLVQDKITPFNDRQEF